MHVAKYLKDVGLLLLVHLDPCYYSGCLMVFPHRSTLIGWPTCVPMRITICKPNLAPNRRICPVLLAYSETAEVWAQANRLSLSCSFILFALIPLFHQDTHCIIHMRSCKLYFFCFVSSRASLGYTKRLIGHRKE